MDQFFGGGENADVTEWRSSSSTSDSHLDEVWGSSSSSSSWGTITGSSWSGSTSGGGTDLERGYGDVRPWRPPFHGSPAARKGPISSKRVSSQDPLLRKFGNFSLNSLKFHPNFSSQAPKFGNFQLTSPQIWKFSAHKPPNLEIFRSQTPFFRGKCQFASPTLRRSGPHTHTWKKSWAPRRVYIFGKKCHCQFDLPLWSYKTSWCT